MSAPARLVASDLDGTLLGSDHQVSARTRAAIAAVSAAGIHVVAATGRSQWTAAPLLETVEGLDLIVCSNGASLFDQRRRVSLASYPIADPVIDEIIAVLAREVPGCLYGWETDTDLFYDEGFVEHRSALERAPSPPLAVGPRPEPIRKLLIGHLDVLHYDLLDLLIPLMPSSCSPSTSGAPFVEVTGDGVTKAFGLRRVCDRLGIGSEEVVAFGDNHNDVEMLQWAGRGIAMGNAHESVRAVVTETTARHDEDGVAAVLEMLVRG